MRKKKDEESLLERLKQADKAERRAKLAESFALTLLATKQWSHAAIIRNAIELADLMLEGLGD